MKIIRTKNEKETAKAAAKFAKRLKGGEVVALYGDLGAGKTVWVRGMAEAFKIKEKVTSPTFVLMRCFVIGNQESGIRNFCHVDAYRLKDAAELEAIGIGDYLGAKDTIVVIEWAERAEGILGKQKIIKVNFEFGAGPDERSITIN